jgi:hypothetical protein
LLNLFSFAGVFLDEQAIT